MADSIETLKELALLIRNATKTGENTAERVGRTLVGIVENLSSIDIEELNKKYLRKDQEDETNFLVTFFKGLKMGKYTTGLLGTGGAVLIDENGNSHAEFDFLNIRKKALFTEITVQELKHIGGALIVSPASMIISSMEETADGYKCYFNRRNSDGKTIYNEFEVGDQGRCQTFNLEKQENGQVGNRYWWRLVTAIGDDYVVFSKTDADTGSDIPKEGDQVSQLGNRNDPTRQNAQIYSAYGSDAPSRKMYQGINSYSLVDKVIKDEYFDVVSGRFKERTYGDAYIGNREGTDYLNNEEGKGLEVSGTVHIKQGSTGAANLTDLPDEVYKAAQIGGENLLRNTGFTGDYTTRQLTSTTSLNQNTSLYSDRLAHWTGTGSVVEDTESVSGFACKIGSLAQVVNLIAGESYVISCKAKGTSLSVSCGGFTETIALTGTYGICSFKFTYVSGGVFMISGNATICEIKLERGTIRTDWCPSRLDKNQLADDFKHLWYLQDALKGSTSILGGLILSTMIQLGQWQNDELKKVTAVLSGIYNDDDDVALAAGGDLEKAIYTVSLFRDDPTHELTDSELKKIANAVLTHGGRIILNDAILRGYIYALGGVFRGTVYAENGEFNGSVRALFFYSKMRNIVFGETNDANTIVDGSTLNPNLHGTNISILGDFGKENIIVLPSHKDWEGLEMSFYCPCISRSDNVIKLKSSAKFRDQNNFELFDYFKINARTIVRVRAYSDGWIIENPSLGEFLN